jgi:hypothetical protein
MEGRLEGKELFDMQTKTLIVCLAAGFLTLGRPAQAVSNSNTAPSHTASFESRHHAALSSGQRYSINFSDIDGRTLSTADDHVTVLVLTTPEDLTRARRVADNVPDYCLGSERYRMVTVLRLTQVGRPIAMVFVRHRVGEEAKRLQTRYDAKKISRPAREDIHVVTDFDGSISAQLGAQSGETGFHVFVFGRDGELLQQWDDVPSAQGLAAVVK